MNFAITDRSSLVDFLFHVHGTPDSSKLSGFVELELLLGPAIGLLAGLGGRPGAILADLHIWLAAVLDVVLGVLCSVGLAGLMRHLG